jgi:iron complex outermembrane recepter protein
VWQLGNSFAVTSLLSEYLSGQILLQVEAIFQGGAFLRKDVIEGNENMTSNFKWAALALTALTPLGVPSVAFAQDSDTTATEDPGGLDEIVITARKKEETLSDAPVSVSVVTSDQIAEQGLNSIDDFAKQTTGISFSQTFGRSTDRPVIRGASNVLAGVQAGVETGAAIFIDGVYFQGDISSFDPTSLERVEVIKGPQSALYGRNTYAGAINYVTKDPSKDLTVGGRLRWAQFDEREVSATVSGKILDDRLGFRVGGRYYRYGGQYTNQLSGKKVGSETTKSVYATLTFDIFDDLKMRSRISYQKDRDGPLALFLQGAADNNCKPGFRSARFRTASPFVPLAPAQLTSTNTNQFFCGVIKPQPNNIQLNTDPINLGTVSPVFNALGIRDGTAFDGILNDQINMSNIVDWDIGGSGWTLSSLTGFRRNKNIFGTDSDHSNAFAYFGGTVASTLGTEPAFGNTNTDYQRDFSQEIRLSTPQDASIRALVGGYYFKQRFDTVDITFQSGRDGRPLGTDSSGRSTIKDMAVFGMVEWDITDNLTIAAEGRYAEEEKTLIERASFSATAPFIFVRGVNNPALVDTSFGCTTALINRVTTTVPAVPNPGCSVGPKAKFSGFDPRLTINYQTDGGMLIYGVYASGRKPGGFNGTAGVTATLQTGQDFIRYLPEKSKGGEIGVKFDAFDRRVRASFAGFYNKLTNVQLTQAIPNPNGTGALTSIVANSGNAKTQGFEVDIAVAASDTIRLNAGISYVDAKFTKGCDADLFILNSGGLRPNFDTRNPNAAGLPLCDITGNRLPLGSPWMVNGSINLDQPLTEKVRLFGLAGFSYEASKYVQTDNLAETGSAFIVNARLGFKTDNMTVAVFGRNLTNEDSIALATRWFDLRYGAGTTGLPAASTVTFNGAPAQIETGSPRGFFGSLRKGRTFGVEATFDF